MSEANLVIAIFGGTPLLGSEVLVEVTGSSYDPAFYIVFFSAVAFSATSATGFRAGRDQR